MNYLNRRGARAVVPQTHSGSSVDGWDTPADVFKATLSHEQTVTALINNLYAMAEAGVDCTTRDCLTWFVNRQVEEEETPRR